MERNSFSFREKLIVAAVTALTFVSPLFIKPGNSMWIRRFILDAFALNNINNKNLKFQGLMGFIYYGSFISLISALSGLNIAYTATLFIGTILANQYFPQIVKLALSSFPNRYLTNLSVVQMLYDNSFKINFFGLEIPSHQLFIPLYVATSVVNYFIEQISHNKITNLLISRDKLSKDGARFDETIRSNTKSLPEKILETAKYYAEYILISLFQFTRKAGPDPFYFLTLGIAWTNFAINANPEEKIRSIQAQIDSARTDTGVIDDTPKANVKASERPAAPEKPQVANRGFVDLISKFYLDCGISR